MALKCINHPGKESVLFLSSNNYCKDCRTGILAAQLKVRQHCVPRACFITYAKANTWERIIGTGCAHYVAHQLGILGSKRNVKCQAGFLFRVPDLVSVTELIEIKNIQLNDIYINPEVDHTGLVIKIEKINGASDKITIQHASSRQEKVAENDFATYFKGNGTFRRYVKK